MKLPTCIKATQLEDIERKERAREVVLTPPLPIVISAKRVQDDATLQHSKQESERRIPQTKVDSGTVILIRSSSNNDDAMSKEVAVDGAAMHTSALYNALNSTANNTVDTALDTTPPPPPI
ncbi:hypothetical protein IE81DRAFT_349673 [Ceraceosorus guamensis]|uniref:Uncharacterized protein n=1 Tax=Ceraceosorus guamensis TaxID=1522189 RepID=A0A316VSE8_9BASI|nr:hypothetical protein IE81DRAFT_349673 [Ceraceosorus guamensis]PWN39978.1 hypothetical protein IE81DRAFT_349673 [Ceraceosorus guamensis]